MWLWHGWGWKPLQTTSPSILHTSTKCLSTLICCPSAYGRSLSQLYPPYLAQILRFCVTTGVNMMMMSLCHGSGWQPPQSASSIHIRHIQSVWAHWYAVHWRTVTALNSYTHPSWLRFWGSVSLVESKWCQHVVVEAEGHLSNCFPHPYYTHLQRVWAH